MKETKVKWISIILSAAILGAAGAVISLGLITYAITDEYEKESSPSAEMNVSEAKPANAISEKEISFEDGKIIFRNAGSGSCPPVVEKAFYDRKTNSYTLELKKYHNKACTMDFRGLQQTISHTDGRKVNESAEFNIV